MQNNQDQNLQTEFDMPTTADQVNAPENTSVMPEATVSTVNLTKAREAKRMSLGDAAYALKIGPKVIESIEASDWAALPGRTFTVGILRAYGRLLEVPVDALIAEVPGATPAMKKQLVEPAKSRKAAPATRRDGETKRQEKKMLKAGAFMVALAVLLAYALPAGIWDGLLQSAQGLVDRWVRPDVVEAPANDPVLPAAPVTSPLSANETAPVAQAQTSPGTLELKFAGPAWVEVRDYSGRIIYSQLNAAGSTQFITGAAPLDVLIGNARQVQARWRDEPVKLDKLSTDDVARQVLR